MPFPETIEEQFSYYPPDDVTRRKYHRINTAAKHAVERASDVSMQAEMAENEGWTGGPGGPFTAVSFEMNNKVCLDLAKAIEEEVPNSANRTAALRCVSLARNALNDICACGGWPIEDLRTFASHNIWAAARQANTEITFERQRQIRGS